MQNPKLYIEDITFLDRDSDLVDVYLSKGFVNGGFYDWQFKHKYFIKPIEFLIQLIKGRTNAPIEMIMIDGKGTLLVFTGETIEEHKTRYEVADLDIQAYKVFALKQLMKVSNPYFRTLAKDWFNEKTYLLSAAKVYFNDAEHYKTLYLQENKRSKCRPILIQKATQKRRDGLERFNAYINS